MISALTLSPQVPVFPPIKILSPHHSATNRQTFVAGNWNRSDTKQALKHSNKAKKHRLNL